jgi:hypothetical protein
LYLIVIPQLSNASIFIPSAYQFYFFPERRAEQGETNPGFQVLHIRFAGRYMVHRFTEETNMYPSFLDSAYCIAQRSVVQCGTEHSSKV